MRGSQLELAYNQNITKQNFLLKESRNKTPAKNQPIKRIAALTAGSLHLSCTAFHYTSVQISIA
jgi:hypothetical protein